MRRMHLFIVDERTLSVHLDYSFAGLQFTEDCHWNNVTSNPSRERAQASLYADICRVHEGDELLFYLEKPSHDRGREGGRFLGVFEVTSPIPFYEPGGAHLAQALGGSTLVYRVLFRPKEIFQQGLTEWQTMDEMTDFRHVHDIPWTLIYRKMEGGRGCTPLLPHEADAIRKALDLKNGGQRLAPINVGFDANTTSLTNTGTSQQYTGTQAPDPITPHLIALMGTDRKWELQLQAYLMQEIGRNTQLTNLLFPNVRVDWIGNEIFAGAGKQRIDVLVFASNDDNTFVHLIELKAGVATSEAADQLNRYIKWLKAHIPSISVHQIVPTIIATGADTGFHDQLKTYLHGHGIGWR